jgi:hypothetical protein
MEINVFSHPWSKMVVKSRGAKKKVIWYPSVELEFETNYGLVRSKFKLDTGADVSILPWDLINDIKGDNKECLDKNCSLKGVLGIPVYGEKWLIKVKVCIPGLPREKWIEMELPFCRSKELKEKYLLGRAAFLDEFRITLVKETDFPKSYTILERKHEPMIEISDDFLTKIILYQERNSLIFL